MAVEPDLAGGARRGRASGCGLLALPGRSSPPAHRSSSGRERRRRRSWSSRTHRAPRRTRAGVPLAGRARGLLLDRLLARGGPPARGPFLTPLVKCLPPDAREATAAEVAGCGSTSRPRSRSSRRVVVVALGGQVAGVLRGRPAAIRRSAGEAEPCLARRPRGLAAARLPPGGGALRRRGGRTAGRGPRRRAGAARPGRPELAAAPAPLTEEPVARPVAGPGQLGPVLTSRAHCATGGLCRDRASAARSAAATASERRRGVRSGEVWTSVGLRSTNAPNPVRPAVRGGQPRRAACRARSWARARVPRAPGRRPRVRNVSACAASSRAAAPAPSRAATTSRRRRASSLSRVGAREVLWPPACARAPRRGAGAWEAGLAGPQAQVEVLVVQERVRRTGRARGASRCGRRARRRSPSRPGAGPEPSRPPRPQARRRRTRAGSRAGAAAAGSSARAVPGSGWAERCGLPSGLRNAGRGGRRDRARPRSSRASPRRAGPRRGSTAP